MVVGSLTHDEADRVFHALADATRRDILLRTLEGQHNVSALARRYPMSFAAVQKHVAVLEGAGLVIKQRKGREQLVSGHVDTMRKATRLLEELETVWRGPDRPDRRDPRRRTQRRSETMTVTSVRKDPEALNMTIITELDATVERAWQLWADPRQLERWWGPPTYPATVVGHDPAAGGRVTYFMTAPTGEKFHGWWEVLAVDPPTRLELKDGFADEEGTPNDAMPTTNTVVSLTERESGGTVMAIETQFPSLEAMEQLVVMGMEEGIVAALGQIPEILAADATTR